MTHRLVLRVFGATYAGPLNRWRAARLGLPKGRSYPAMLAAGRETGTPWLFGYSRSVLPKPIDWADDQNVTGYWFLDPPPEWQPPLDLVRFLERGPAPLYIGFGSVGDANAERRARIVARALELTGQRAVIASGWGGLARLPVEADVHYIEDVPHSWLFPRMSAVMHHGGAGTTAAALRAGVPSLITPFAIDQYGWAEQVVRLGAGPPMPDAHRLTVEKLAQAIDAATNDTALRARAAALGEKIRAEAGVAATVAVIERHAAAFKTRTARAAD